MEFVSSAHERSNFARWLGMDIRDLRIEIISGA
jgi:hypothetical protein